MGAKLRIGVIYDQQVTNAYYRVQFPLEELEKRGHEVRWETQRRDGTLDLELLRGCDLVHVYRRADVPVASAVDQLRQRGVAVTWDNDDDITLMPKESPMYKRSGGAAARRDFLGQRDLFRRVAMVTTTSPVLAKRYTDHGARAVRVIENSIGPDSFMRAGGRRHEGFVIGWVAALEHRADANRLRIPEVLREILTTHPSAWVQTIGLDLRLPPEQYRHAGVIPFPRLPGYLRRFDIAIAPLADVPMSYARSDIKVKEYAACGVPWLASARGPYATLGPEQGGRLVEDDAWFTELDRLIRSRRDRRRLRRAGAAWAREHSIARRADLWEQAFREAIESTMPKIAS